MCSPSRIPKIASWLNFCFSSTMGSKKDLMVSCVWSSPAPALLPSSLPSACHRQDCVQWVRQGIRWCCFSYQKRRRGQPLLRSASPDCPCGLPGSWLTSGYHVFTWMNCTLQRSLWIRSQAVFFDIENRVFSFCFGLPCFPGSCFPWWQRQSLAYLFMERHWVFKSELHGGHFSDSYWQLRWSWEGMGAIQLNTFNLGES